MNLSDVIETAKELGAVKYAASYFPQRPKYFGIIKTPEISFYYFFNAEGLEVLNFCPALAETGHGISYQNPARKWCNAYLNELIFERIL